MTSAPTVPARVTVPHRVRNALLTLAVPVAVQAAAAGVALSWRDTLPDPVATHWGTDGPDGFTSVTASVLTMGAIAVGLAILFWAIGHFWGQVASTRRLAAGVGVGMSVLMAGVQLLTLAPQRGLDDATRAGDVDAAMALSLAAALAVGALVAWLLVPGDVERAATAPVPASAERVRVPDGERAAWIARISGGPSLWIFVLATASLAVAAVLSAQWWLLAVPAVLGALGATMFVWDVRVDTAGLHVRSAAGWPRVDVPATSVESAAARQVRPLKEFGGYGWRTAAGGAIGIILRGGEGIEVVHSGGKRLVVTIDDAATAAALLNTMADRTR